MFSQCLGGPLSLTLPTSLILYQFPAFALSVSFHLSFSQTNFRFILSLPLYLHPSFHHSPGRGSLMWSPHGWRCKLRGEKRWRSTTSGCKGWSHLEEEMQMVTPSYFCPFFLFYTQCTHCLINCYFSDVSCLVLWLAHTPARLPLSTLAWRTLSTAVLNPVWEHTRCSADGAYTPVLV